ncbi:MAG: HPr(Ser) kinase/phosphatase [Mariprofundaceae bacterium]
MGDRGVTVRALFEAQAEELRLRLLTGEDGLDRVIDHPRVEKPALAFAGYLTKLNPNRLQVIGQSELGYLKGLAPEKRRRAVDAVFDHELAAVVVTYGAQPPDDIVEAAQRTRTPLFVSELDSQTLMTHATLHLNHQLAPRTFVHGVCLDIFGLGVLLTGASGIGKSEIGLELISRGHRLIADDMVELARERPDVLVARSPESLRYHMEIRGLGILNIRDLYGAAAITDAKRLRLVVDLVPWERAEGKERATPGDETAEFLDVRLPRSPIPIRPGRSLAVLVEVATRNQLLKLRGIDSGERFARALQERIRRGGEG